MQKVQKNQEEARQKMTEIICWICGCNLAYRLYDDTKLLDENGNRPCLECIAEAEEENDE